MRCENRPSSTSGLRKLRRYANTIDWFRNKSADGGASRVRASSVRLRKPSFAIVLGTLFEPIGMGLNRDVTALRLSRTYFDAIVEGKRGQGQNGKINSTSPRSQTQCFANEVCKTTKLDESNSAQS